MKTAVESGGRAGLIVPALQAYAVIRAVAAAHGIAIDTLRGPSRKAPIVRARHEAAWRLRMERKLSYPAIGRLLHRDHATVMAAVRKIARAAASDPGLRASLERPTA